MWTQRHTVSTATGYRTKSWEHLVVSVKVTQVQLDSQEEKSGGGGERGNYYYMSWSGEMERERVMNFGLDLS